jgi:hypothetical protein
VCGEEYALRSGHILEISFDWVSKTNSRTIQTQGNNPGLEQTCDKGFRVCARILEYIVNYPSSLIHHNQHQIHFHTLK